MEWEPDQRLLTRRCTEAAVDFIDANADADRPFFAYVPHAMPHIPLYASEDFEGTSRRGLYGDVIEEIDWSMGEIVAALERHGILDDTIVVFATDNGPWLPFKQDGGSAGPLAGGKGGNQGGRATGAMPCPSSRRGFLRGWWCGRSRPRWTCFPPSGRGPGSSSIPSRTIDGHDITALLAGEKDATSPTEVFLYYTAHGKLAGIRQGRWKLMLESGSLHDLEVDVAEKWNLAKKHPAVVERLRGEALGAGCRDHRGSQAGVEGARAALGSGDRGATETRTRIRALMSNRVLGMSNRFSGPGFSSPGPAGSAPRG